MISDFFEKVRQFNKVFGLPLPSTPTYEGDARLERFAQILQEEVDEQADISPIADDMDKLVALADRMGDIVVYCTSEAYRHGIPLDKVLTIIMVSNMSKLDEVGRPIVVDGKVQKGPNYYKPESYIKALLEEEQCK